MVEGKWILKLQCYLSKIIDMSNKEAQFLEKCLLETDCHLVAGYLNIFINIQDGID